MARIGVYSVDSTELEKPPAEREYTQQGTYRPQEQAWDDSTDDRIQYLLPSGGETSYTIKDIQARIESATLQVYFEGEVPGTVTNADRILGPNSASD